MFRPAPSLLIALCALLASATVAAKTSVASLQPAELPCPSNRSEGLGTDAPASAPTTSSTTGETTLPRSGAKAARQRWKALLPGTLKSAT